MNSRLTYWLNRQFFFLDGMIELIKLYKTSKAISQVLFIIFLLAIGGVQIASAQTALPSCHAAITFSDDDGVDPTMDIDKDDDGLIEICDLEGFYEIRYQLDGTGYRASADASDIIDTGCGGGDDGNSCVGYELTKSLDFTDSSSYRTTANKITWTMGEGWRPIEDFSNAFSARFEGNGYAVSNLMINRSDVDGVGLFGSIQNRAEIANLGLPNVDIIGSSQVGGLVGSSFGSITKSYTTGSITGDSSLGGLVGNNRGSITSSYTTASVTGDNSLGGLVGNNRGSITNSYATGLVSGRQSVGGLVGRNRRGTITGSYWNINISGIRISAGGMGITTEALQLPVTATGIYINWSSKNWDFGTRSQYPVLKHTNSNALLLGQGIGLRDLEVLTVGARLTPVFGASTTHYVIGFPVDARSVDLAWKAYNNDAMIEIVKQNDSDNNLVEGNSSGRSSPIPIDEDTVLVITVTEANASTTSYTVCFQEVEISDIIVFEQGGKDTDSIVDEGSTVTLNILGVGNYSYEWSQTQGKPLILSSTATTSPSFTIPADYIEAAASTSTDIVVQLTLVHNELDLPTITLSKRITIRKKNNDMPILDLGLTVNGLTLSFDETGISDADGMGTFEYQWEIQGINAKWGDIETATTASYTVSEDSLDGSLYRVRVTYIDAQGYSDTEYVPELGIRVDVDIDDDGLIEIYYLEQLDAIRYVLDGSGYKADIMATTNTLGCPNDGCSGYELMRDLDFTNKDSYSSIANRITWTMGEGWQPIGSIFNTFSARFEGNAHTISNLIINRNGTVEVGLFGYTNSKAKITNLGLLNVNIIGRSQTGSLVGSSYGSITNSYATGVVSGSDVNIGGLVGDNYGAIMGSYAAVAVTGTGDRAGGLVGWNDSSAIIANSYATGAVSGDSFIGGLVGFNFRGAIENSYATGDAEGDDDVGGLVGENEGSIDYSYWLVGSAPSGGHGVSMSAGQTDKELKLPETSSGIYSEWSTKIWNFGTSRQYPVLKDADRNTLLPGQGVGLRDLEVLTSATELSPPFGASITHYVIGFPVDVRSIDLAWRAYNNDATIEIVKQNESDNNLAGKGNSGGGSLIPIDENTVLNITVTEADDSVTSYTITFFSFIKSIQIQTQVRVFLEGLLQ